MRLVLLLLATPAFAANYVVAPNGDDTANGSAATPWKTLQHAADQVAAGDSVSVQAGTYVGFQIGYSTPKTGAMGAPITFTAQSGVVINAPNAKTADGIDLEGASWVVLDGFEVTGVTRAGIRTVWDGTTNATNVTVRNCYTHDNGTWGIFTSHVDNLLIEHNRTSHAGTQHGIYVSNACVNPVVRGNEIFSNNANGLHMNGDISQGGTGIITGALVEKNVIYDNGAGSGAAAGGGSGINCDGVQNSKIQNNLIYAEHSSGISLYKIDAAMPATGNLVVNNTIVVASDGRWAVNIQDASVNNTVLNNILLNLSARGAVQTSTDSLSGLVSDYNLVVDKFTPDTSTVLTLAQWQAMTNQDKHSIVLGAGSIFAGPTDFHLLPTAQAIGKGTMTNAPSDDLDGFPRSGAIDIGAYQYHVGGDDMSIPNVDDGGHGDSDDGMSYRPGGGGSGSKGCGCSLGAAPVPLNGLWMLLLFVASLLGCGSPSGNGGDGGGNRDLATSGGGNDLASGGGDGGAGACANPVASAPAVTLADFENGAVPNSEAGATEGFRSSDVARATIVTPGANGTTKAASFDYATDNAVFFQGNARPQYLDGSSTYHPDLANAIELWLKVPAGSPLLAATGTTLGLWTYHWLHGDPWVGTNGTGGNLTDSQMHGYSNFRVDPAAADAWTHAILSTSAFAQSRGNYHFYAARAVAQDQTFFGSLRQFEIVSLVSLSAGATLGLDELRLITLPPTAGICPAFASQSVKASAGDVIVPIQIVNPGTSTRSYRAFLSSEIGVDRQTLEVAMHDTDAVAAVDDLQGAVGADGGPGAAELFADDGNGKPTGAAIITSATAIQVAAGATWKGVVVHHVTPGMLGAQTPVTTGGMSYMVKRDTLTTSLIVWDPAEPRRADAAVVFGGSNADSDHPAPPGFPTWAAPPTGWASADVPLDQAAGYFVSVLTLQP
jgi:hypothetical protein